MYDLIVCVLGSSKNEERLKQFLEIGINNLNKYKTKTVYLSGEFDVKPCFISEEWKNIKSPLSSRFLSYLKNEDIQSRWILQVDDDSCTDIDRTLDIIDKFYDWQDPVVITGSSIFFINGKPHGAFYMEDSLQKIAAEMNLQDLFLGTNNLNNFEIIPRFKHAWEQSMLSFSAVNKIKKSEKINDFLNLCETYHPQYTDQVPYFAAKLCKIPIDECFIFCPLPVAEEYTAINKTGRYTHIHHVLDYWEEIDNLKHIIKNKITFKDKFDSSKALKNNSLVKSVWLLEVDGVVLGKLKLGENGLVECYKNPNEYKWEYRQDICFFNKKEQMTSSLKKINETTYQGKSLITSSVLTLKKIDIINLIGMGGIK